jgi:hypothetical protein
MMKNVPLQAEISVPVVDGLSFPKQVPTHFHQLSLTAWGIRIIVKRLGAKTLRRSALKDV